MTAITVLAAAPTPTTAATLTEAQLRELLRAARYSAPRATPARLRAILIAPQLRQHPRWKRRWGWR